MRMLMGPHPLVENHQQMLSWRRILMKRMLLGPHPLVENLQLTLYCLPNRRACHWHLHCSRSQEMCPFGGTPPATLMPVLVNVRRTSGASCYQYPKECSPVFTPSWLSAGIGMPLSSG